MFEYGRSLGADGNTVLQQALDLFESAVNPPDFYAQRKAELLILMGQAERAEAILSTLEKRNNSGWIQRLYAQALYAQGYPSEALGRIDAALKDVRCNASFHEFWELRYKIRTLIGQCGAIVDLRTAWELAPEGPIKEKLKTDYQRLNPNSKD